MSATLSCEPLRDFAAVVPLGITPFVLVVAPDKGFKTARERVDAAHARPGGFNFATVGEGSASHLSAERFRLSAGLQAVHVPYKGGPEAMTDVMAGRIDFFFVAMSAALAQISAGKLAALAVNSPKRSAALPEVPTTQEAGFSNAEFPTWFGVFLPAQTPRNVVDRLHGEARKALQEPKVREHLEKLGVEPMIMTASEFDAHGLPRHRGIPLHRRRPRRALPPAVQDLAVGPVGLAKTLNGSRPRWRDRRVAASGG